MAVDGSRQTVATQVKLLLIRYRQQAAGELPPLKTVSVSRNLSDALGLCGCFDALVDMMLCSLIVSGEDLFGEGIDDRDFFGLHDTRAKPVSVL